MLESVINFLLERGLTPQLSKVISRIITLIITFIICFASYLFIKYSVLNALSFIIKKTKTKFDDILLENKTFIHIPKLVPALILIYLIPMIFSGYENIVLIVNRFIYSYITLLILLTLNSAITALSIFYKNISSTMKLPITSLIQVLRIILTLICVLIIIAIMLNRSPLIVLSGLGALTAVFMLVFKDSLMGFVAGIQLTLNKMVDYGNWISMPKYGADGNVVDITLTTIKVCNWDNTVTMVPTYALMSESFKNWKSMSESGGRRIKRSIYIDMQSIKFCDNEMLKKVGNIQKLSEYINNSTKDIENFNNENNIDASSPVNGRRLTNIGLFRHYIESYLKTNPNIHESMTLLVRQLQPTKSGLPIEIYVFSKETMWEKYESIQADIFDHIFAIIKEFDLEIFQSPSGGDLKNLSR